MPGLSPIPLIGSTKALEDVGNRIIKAGPDKSLLILGGPGAGKWVTAAAAHLLAAAATRGRRAVIEINCADLERDDPLKHFFERLFTRRTARDRATAYDVILRNFQDLDEPWQSRFFPLAIEGSAANATVRFRRLLLLGGGPVDRYAKEIRGRIDRIELPTLAESPDDIAPFADYFLGRFHRRDVEGGRFGPNDPRAGRAPSLGPDAGPLLAGLSWDDNRRELIRRMAEAYERWFEAGARDGALGAAHFTGGPPE